MTNLWNDTDEGNMLGTIGAEGGKIIHDVEHDLGARISLEKKSDTAPAAITLSIYGVVDHTIFYESIEEGRSALDHFKSQIEKVLYHYKIDESIRDDTWNDEEEALVDAILAQ